MTSIVRAGTLAPSGDNCQPWQFRWNGQFLKILFVPQRAASFYDVGDRASWISLGAGLYNMRIAAKALGYEIVSELFPAGEEPGVVARCRLAPTAPQHDPLVDAIERRCVNRRPYRPELLPSIVRHELTDMASMPGVHLSWIEDEPMKARVAWIAAENDRMLFENRALHEGLYHWLRWSRTDPGWGRDGMPVETLELSRIERPGIRLLGSWRLTAALSALGLSRMLPLRASRVYRRSAAIALLTVTGARPENFVRGGEIVERIWLTATLRGVGFQPITGIICLLLRLALVGGEGLSRAHRTRLAAVAGALRAVFPHLDGETPVMLFRLGFAPPPSGRAPRLPLSEVFEMTPTKTT